MKALKTLAFFGFFISTLAFFYVLWVTYGSGQKSLAMTPSAITIISLFCLLSLWADRLYRLLTHKKAERPIPLKKRWARDGVVRLFSWTSGLVASGCVFVWALALLAPEQAMLVTVAGLILFGAPMFMLEQQYFRSRAPR